MINRDTWSGMEEHSVRQRELLDQAHIWFTVDLAPLPQETQTYTVLKPFCYRTCLASGKAKDPFDQLYWLLMVSRHTPQCCGENEGHSYKLVKKKKSFFIWPLLCDCSMCPFQWADVYVSQVCTVHRCSITVWWVTSGTRDLQRLWTKGQTYYTDQIDIFSLELWIIIQYHD